ncbi:MAG TPA: efflux RND transporter periplasmic adaptor subunit [Terracidiphilus sp.]|nr:efflux RND transporter periplasmic adaptor subunit [Terracidiphilus sp.]
MKTRSYQIALAFASAVCLALAVALAWVLFTRGSVPTQSNASSEVVLARGPAAGGRAALSSPGAAQPASAAPELAPLQISPQRLQEIGVTMADVAEKDVSDTLQVPGNVDVNEQRLAYVQTRFAGWIQTVHANATYQYVRKGQPLFAIYSPELVSSEQEYLLARQNQNAFEPDAHSMAGKERGWLLKAAEERLRQFDVPAEQIAALERTGKVQRDIEIDSPASGYILERNALPNAYVQPETKLYTIADLSSVWVYANVYQSDIGRLRPGDSADVTVDAYPGRTFHGRVDQILPQVDSTTRTVRVRLVFSNPGLVLKPGMFVNVSIRVRLGRQLVVPASVVLHSGMRSVAFVDHGNGSLEPRTVQTGPQIDDSILILSGLKAGERVVQSANFLVDSEAQLQAAMQGFSPIAQQAPPSAPASTAPAVNVRLDTEPSPPRKGANLLRVTLTGADGKAVTGAQVEVTFFMAAMPAMGMSAMRATATLAERGGGRYEGPLTLDSGGTWRVTVTVRRNGQILTQQQLTLDATGGMG